MDTDEIAKKAKEERHKNIYKPMDSVFDIVQKPLIEEIERLKIERNVWRKDFFKIAEVEKENKELKEFVEDINNLDFIYNSDKSCQFVLREDIIKLLNSLRKSDESKSIAGHKDVSDCTTSDRNKNMRD